MSASFPPFQVATETPRARDARVVDGGVTVAAPLHQVALIPGGVPEGLRELGYVEGRNIAFVQRYGDGKMERLPDLAAELVRLKVLPAVSAVDIVVRTFPSAYDSSFTDLSREIGDIAEMLKAENKQA